MLPLVDLLDLLAGALALLAGSVVLLALVAAHLVVRRVALLTPPEPSPEPAARRFVRALSSGRVTDTLHHPRRPRAPGTA